MRLRSCLQMLTYRLALRSTRRAHSPGGDTGSSPVVAPITWCSDKHPRLKEFMTALDPGDLLIVKQVLAPRQLPLCGGAQLERIGSPAIAGGDVASRQAYRIERATVRVVDLGVHRVRRDVGPPPSSMPSSELASACGGAGRGWVVALSSIGSARQRSRAVTSRRGSLDGFRNRPWAM